MRHTQNAIAGAALAALLSTMGMSAHAATTDVNLAGWTAVGDFGAAGNTELTLNLGAGATITGFSYINLQFTTSGDSWQNELVISVNNSDASEFFDWAPSETAGPGTFGPASGSYGGPVGVEGPYGSSTGPFVLADGQAFITTYLSYDLPPVGINISAGTLRIEYTPAAVVPEPGTYGLMALGLLGVATIVRRRRA